MKPRKRVFVEQVLIIDGEYHLIVERRRDGVVTSRLRGWERDLAVKYLDDTHAEIEARVIGRRRRLAKQVARRAERS